MTFLIVEERILNPLFLVEGTLSASVCQQRDIRLGCNWSWQTEYFSVEVYAMTDHCDWFALLVFTNQVFDWSAFFLLNYLFMLNWENEHRIYPCLSTMHPPILILLRRSRGMHNIGNLFLDHIEFLVLGWCRLHGFFYRGTRITADAI